MKALALVFALVCSTAMADGVPMISAGGKASPALEQSIKKARPDVIGITPVTLNRNAFGANVINVTLDGKLHTFVGSMTPGRSEIQSWYGKEGDIFHGGAVLTLTKNQTTGMMVGTMRIGSRNFEIENHAGKELVVERDPARARSVPAGKTK